MNKTEIIKCKKCKKKVEPVVKEKGELVCPNCANDLGFFTPENLFIEMVQVYLDFKKINAIATVGYKGHLDIQINFDTEDYTILSDLLSKCMPVSYIITNTAVDKVDRRAGKGNNPFPGKQPRSRKSVSKRNKNQKDLGVFLN